MNSRNEQQYRDIYRRKTYERVCLVGWAQRIRRHGNPPQNSLHIVNLAQKLMYDVVEIDIRIAADGVPVLAHDKVLKSFDGNSVLVHETTSKSLQAIQIGMFEGEAVYIPTLAQALTTARTLDVQLDARIDPAHVQLLRRVVDDVDFDPFRLQFCVYNRAMAEALVRTFPESVLLWKHTPPNKPITRTEIETIAEIGMDGIMVRFPRDDHDFESLMNMARPLGLRVLVYIHGRETPYPEGPNEALDAIQDAGIDYVTTFAGETDGFKKIKPNNL